MKEEECVLELSLEVGLLIASALLHQYTQRRRSAVFARLQKTRHTSRKVLQAIRGESRNHAKTAVDLEKKKKACCASMDDVRQTIFGGQLGFIIPERKESAFIDGSYEPPTTMADLRDVQPSGFRQQMRLLIMRGPMMLTMWEAINNALLVSIGATLVWKLKLPETAEWISWIITSSGSEIRVLQHAASFVSDFKYLPTFLIGFMVNEEARRWMASFKLALSVQGRCHDLGLFLSGAFNDSSLETRKKHFKFYRYITAAHYMLYFKRDPRIASDKRSVCKDLQAAGLLTPKEATSLVAKNRMRDTLLAWISNLFQREVRAGHIRDTLTTKFLEELARMRGLMGAFGDAYDTYPTNTHSAMLGVTITILVGALMLKYVQELSDDQMCLQPAAFIVSFFIICCYLGMVQLLNVLAKSPFDPTGEPVNIDQILCSTDQFLWDVLRSSYGDNENEKEGENEEAEDKSDPASPLYNSTSTGGSLSSDDHGLSL